MSRFLSQYLLLRFKLFYRSFELGLLFWILPVIAFGGGILASFKYPEFIYSKQLHLLLGNSSLLIWIHNKRKDHSFLKNTLNSTQLKAIYSIEYFLLSSPFIITAIITGNWLHCFIILVILGTASFSFSIKNNRKPISILKKWNIEWNSGGRTHGAIPLIALGAYLLCFFLPTTSYLNLFLYGIVILSFSSFQATEEAPSLIRIFDCSSQQFLAQKIKTHLKPIVVISLVSIIPIILLETEFWLMILLITIQGIAYNINTVLGKYANYQNEAGKVITSIVKIIFTVIPFLIPLNILLSIFLYRKAVSSLNPYLLC